MPQSVKLRVLVTRPAQESASIAAMLAAEEHEAIVSPLLDIRFVEGPQISLARFQAIVATSANGMHALAFRTTERQTPVYAVGPETAAAARAKGFRIVRQSDGDAHALALMVQQWERPDGAPLLYAAGRDRTGDLEQALAENGYTVQVEPLYEARMVSLSEEAIAALNAGAVDAVMVFSARTAQAFLDEVWHRRMQHACTRLAVLCISPAVAAVLSAERFAAIHVAASSNREAMLALLRDLAAARAKS